MIARSLIRFLAAGLLAASLSSTPTSAQVNPVCPLPGQTGTCTMPLASQLLPLDPVLQPKFVNELPVPIFYTPDVATYAGFDYYEIKMSAVTQAPVAFPQPAGGAAVVPPGKQWLGLVDPLLGTPLFTEVWGYGQISKPDYPLVGLATYPSMSFKATRGRPVKVKWINEAPDTHLFCKAPTDSNVPCAIDRTLMGTKFGAGVTAFGSPQQPDNAMVVHLHGGEIPPDSDGFAELWFGNLATAAAYPPSAFPAVAVTGSTLGAAQNIDPILSPTTANGIEVGNLIRPTGNSMFYNYPMVQPSATLWYHDHALGKTRVNVAAGPAGFFVVEDPAQEAIVAPLLPAKGDCSTAGTLAGNCYDVPIVLQDRAFNADGSINFPNGLGQTMPAGWIGPWDPVAPGPNPTIHPQWVPEYFGDVAVVNGVAWPKMTVEPRPYRFRFLDGSNARCYTLALKAPAALIQPPWWIVGGDQGYLPAPVAANKWSFCPGERYEVVIDFSAFAGQSVFVNNSAAAPFPNGVAPNAKKSPFSQMAQLLRFDVLKPLNPAFPAGAFVAAPLLPVTRLPTANPVGVVPPPVAQFRELVLNEVLDPVTLAPLRVQIDGKAFEDPITETPRRGTVEVWSFINTTVDAHPIHLHLVQFQAVSRQKVDVARYGAAIGLAGLANGGQLTKVPVAPYLVGGLKAPLAQEMGFKDTVVTYPGEVTTVVARWDGGWQDTPVCAVPPAGYAGPIDPVSTCMCGPDLLVPAACAVPVQPIYQPFWEPVTAGPYVWHCHIVDHEDNEMMRPALVIP
jgi:spore coat protein A, manganese oxidase